MGTAPGGARKCDVRHLRARRIQSTFSPDFATTGRPLTASRGKPTLAPVALGAVRLAAMVVAMAVGGCLGDTAAPRLVAGGRAAFSVEPRFASSVAFAVPFDRLRVTLSRSTGTALDTVIAWPAADTALALTLTAEISGAAETLSLDLAFINATGDTVYRGGPTPVTLTAGSVRPSQAQVATRYTGVGANAASVRITTRTLALFFRDSVVLTATAFDAANQPIAGTPIQWRALNPTVAAVDTATGKVVAGTARGLARVQAVLPTALADTAQVTVQPLPVAIGLVSGGGQTGPVIAPLPQPVVVLVKAADSLPVQGVAVQFSAGGGGTVSKAADTTTASGTASTTWTLGTALGAQTLTAKLASAPTVTVSAGATAVAGAAKKLAFQVQPGTAVTNVALAPAVQIVAQDSLGNTATAFTGNVTLAFGANPTGATLAGTLTVAAVAGVATFSGISVDNIASGYTLTASATGLAAATSASFAITAAANVNAWINQAGGNWSSVANWSKGRVPLATDTITIRQSGSYTVTLDANGTFARMDVGGTSGTQTLAVPANTLTAGNGAFSANGVLALSGTGTITGAGTLTVAGAFNWTGGNLGGASGAGGGIAVPPGGTLSIAPTAAVSLQAWTLALAGTGTWSGTATVNTGAGALLRVASGGVLGVTGGVVFNASLGGAAPLFDNGGTVNSAPGAATWTLNVPLSGAGAWNVQSGAVSLQGGGALTGATTVAAGATLRFDNGTYSYGAGASVGGAGAVLSTAGSVTFGGAWGITGLTTVGGGSLAFAGATGSVAALTLTAGTFGDSGAFAVTGATSWSGGTINVTGGRLKLAGGSGASFGGTANVAAGDTLDLAGGTFTLARALTVSGTGALLVSGGSLVLNGFAASVGGSFATLGSGAVTMANALDSLDITGNATFAGAAGTLSAGRIRLAGNFSQTTSAAAFAATGTHRTVLDGTAAQSISFANPTTSFFRRLEIPAITHNVVLQTGVQVTDSLTMFGGGGAATMSGAGTSQRLTVGGLLSLQLSTLTPKLTPPVIELSVAPNIAGLAGSLSADTTVYLGSIATLPVGAGIAYKSVRVNTSGALASPGNVTCNGNLIVSAGTYAMGSGVDSVAGFFRTEGTGALSMVAVVASPSLAVRDSAVFAGGASSGLTGGVLRIWGNFVQRGTGGQFAPSGAHRVVFQRATAGAQTVLFADSVNSFFHDLVVNATVADTLRLLSNVQVQDSAVLGGTAAAVLVSNAAEALKLPAAGVLMVHSLAVLQPFRAEAGDWELDSLPVGSAAGRISPDTAVVLNGTAFNSSPFTLSGAGISSSSPAVAWQSLRLTGGTLSSNGTTFAGDLIIQGGTYSLFSARDSVAGFLRTEATGILSLGCGDCSAVMVVGDSAVFAGGTSALTNFATLKLLGNFVQRGPNATSFAADTGHTTQFAGSGTQLVTFANPGGSASRFGNLLLNRVNGQLVSQVTSVSLGSDVAVVGVLEDTSAAVADTIAGNGHTITASGFALSDTYISNAPVVVPSTLQLLSGNVVTFANMSPTVTQLTLSRGAGTFALQSFAFQVAPTTGRYFAATNTAPVGVPAANFTFATPVQPTTTPTSAQYLRLGSPAAIVVWGTITLP